MHKIKFGINLKLMARKVLLTAMVACLPGLVMASGGGVQLDHADIDLSDKASMQRGARLFVNYCQSCHSARFMRVNRIAADLDIPEDLAAQELLLGDAKIGDTMQVTMPAEQSKKWFGTAPPDLSLTARLRGPDWLYTYFRTFYRDPGAPSGWNNTTFENVAMPHVLTSLQGVQELVEDGHGGHELKLVSPGSMSVKEYDTAARDLTAFMTYVGEPIILKRKTYGIYVLIFLGFLFVLSYFLKKEYWRDVH